MVAKATATSLAKIYGGKLTDAGFIYVKGPEVLAPYVGVAERTIRSLFDRARQYKAKSGFAATIFIDEADALLSKRGSGISSDVNNTIVPMFLSEMDGLQDSSAFIILATNVPERLDPAVLREGRIDKKIKIPRPNERSVGSIVKIALEGVPCLDSSKEIADKVCEEVFSTSLQDSISGAVVIAIIEQAVSVAIHRDLKAGKNSGLTIQDVDISIKQLRKREADMIPEEVPV